MPGVVKDVPKVGIDRDQVVKWIFNTVTAVSLAIGAWYFGTINSNVNLLTDAVNGLKTEVALQRQFAQGELNYLRNENSEIKTVIAGIRAKIEKVEESRFTNVDGDRLEERLRTLELELRTK